MADEGCRWRVKSQVAIGHGAPQLFFRVRQEAPSLLKAVGLLGEKEESSNAVVRGHAPMFLMFAGEDAHAPLRHGYVTM